MSNTIDRCDELREARRKAFLGELRDLLSKYNATIEANDEWQGYAECGEDIHIRVSGECDPLEDEFPCTRKHYGFEADLGSRFP